MTSALWDKCFEECVKNGDAYDKYNTALMLNYKLAPVGFSTFFHLGGERWNTVLPNDPMPLYFDGLKPKSFEQELEEMERNACQSVAVNHTTSEGESDATPAGRPPLLEVFASFDSSLSSPGSALLPLTTDITSSEEDGAVQRMSRVTRNLSILKISADRKRARGLELEAHDDESSSASSNGSKRQRLSNSKSSLQSAISVHKHKNGTRLASATHHRYRSPKALHGFLTDSSSSKSRSTGRLSGVSVIEPIASTGSLKRRRDDVSETETATSASDEEASIAAKRRRVEIETRVVLPMAKRTSLTGHSKVSNWLAHGTLAAPVLEDSDSDLATDRDSQSGYDVDAESADDEQDVKAPRFLSAAGRSVADRFQAPKEAHYAESDAAEDEEPMTFWKMAEVYRYAVPNPDGRL